MKANKEIAVKNENFGALKRGDFVQAGRWVDCKCRRCRTKWVEIDDTKHTNGTGHAWMCQKCLANAIDRTRYYTPKT